MSRVVHRSAPAAVLALTVALLSAACSSGGSRSPETEAPAGNGPAVQSWVTTGDKTQLLAPQPVRQFGTAALQPLRIEVDATRSY